jgi:hypothetical protein
MTDFGAVLGALGDAGVEFIVVGGLAAVVHGSARVTQDVDVVYSRTPENIARLVRALAPHEPYLRGAPPGLPFRWNEETVRRGLNFTLTTRLGALDLLGEITGGGGYEALLPHTIRLPILGRPCLCLDLPTLIRVKRAAGRPRDYEAVSELEVLAEERLKRGSTP